MTGKKNNFSSNRDPTNEDSKKIPKNAIQCLPLDWVNNMETNLEGDKNPQSLPLKGSNARQNRVEGMIGSKGMIAREGISLKASSASNVSQET